MKESELETMRKSFKTVKDRSSKIKNSSSIKRLEKRVREIEKESIANKEELMDIAVESFGEMALMWNMLKLKMMH